MDTKTLRCGLLGRKLGHSYSPAIHERLADYSYRLFEVEPEDLGAFLQEGAFDGLNVTIPYKKDVIPYCAELSDTARAIGAVNTLVRRADGTLWGDNTDAYGFSMLVQSTRRPSACIRIPASRRWTFIGCRGWRPHWTWSTTPRARNFCCRRKRAGSGARTGF